MPTEWSPDLIGLAPVAGRRVVAAFDGGALTSDAGALLLGAADRAIRLVERFAACFQDDRAAGRIEHRIETRWSAGACSASRSATSRLRGWRRPRPVAARSGPGLAVLAGKLAARRSDCAPLAGKSTLNRLEHAPAAAGPTRYRRIGHDPAAIERLLVVDLFPEAHAAAPKRIVLDLAATDDPPHGHREGRFFSTAPTTAGATCRSTSSSAAVTCSRPRSCGAPTSMPRPAPLRRSNASSRRSGSAGRGCASCCRPTAASPARR